MINKRLYKSLLLLVVIIFSYIGLLFFISNEGLKDNTVLPRNGVIEADISRESMPLNETNLKDIQINKNLLYME